MFKRRIHIYIKNRQKTDSRRHQDAQGKKIYKSSYYLYRNELQCWFALRFLLCSSPQSLELLIQNIHSDRECLICIQGQSYMTGL